MPVPSFRGRSESNQTNHMDTGLCRHPEMGLSGAV